MACFASLIAPDKYECRSYSTLGSIAWTRVSAQNDKLKLSFIVEPSHGMGI